MPPISVIFVVSGLAVLVNGLYFLGVGAKPKPEVGSPDPIVSVGWITLLAGLVDLAQAAIIIGKFPTTFGAVTPAIPLAGLIVFYGTFFFMLGITMIKGLDLRVVGNLSAAVAIVPLLWVPFFAGSWMFTSILIVWLFAFLAVTATTYGKLPGKVLGVGLLLTAVYTFLLPAGLMGLGIPIP